MVFTYTSVALYRIGWFSLVVYITAFKISPVQTDLWSLAELILSCQCERQLILCWSENCLSNVSHISLGQDSVDNAISSHLIEVIVLMLHHVILSVGNIYWWSGVNGNSMRVKFVTNHWSISSEELDKQLNPSNHGFLLLVSRLLHGRRNDYLEWITKFNYKDQQCKGCTWHFDYQPTNDVYQGFSILIFAQIFSDTSFKYWQASKLGLHKSLSLTHANIFFSFYNSITTLMPHCFTYTLSSKNSYYALSPCLKKSFSAG